MLSTQSYIFGPHLNYPFLITGKRYYINGSPTAQDSNGYTLIFTHGTSFHKEQWEPTLGDLNALLQSRYGTPRML